MMKPAKIKAGQVFKVPAHHLIGLSPEQVKTRMHNLNPTGTDDVYETKAEVEFKGGEVIGLSPGGLSRAQLDMLEDFEPEPKRKRGKSAEGEQDPAK
jgi:hypothetical protein